MTLDAPKHLLRCARARGSCMPLLCIAALLSLSTPACAFTSAGPECSRRAAVGQGVVVEGEVTGRGDSIVTVAICMNVPAARRVGSYHGELTFSAARAIVVAVTKPEGGMRVENVQVPGQVNFAGALSDGTGSGELLTVTLRTTGHDDGVPTRLRMIELNDLAGNSLLPLTRVDSLPLAAKTARSSAVHGSKSQRGKAEARWRPRASPHDRIGVSVAAAKAALGACLLASTGPECVYLHKLVLRQET